MLEEVEGRVRALADQVSELRKVGIVPYSLATVERQLSAVNDTNKSTGAELVSYCTF